LYTNSAWGAIDTGVDIGPAEVLTAYNREKLTGVEITRIVTTAKNVAITALCVSLIPFN
jgi:hypothetical protein